MVIISINKEKKSRRNAKSFNLRKRLSHRISNWGESIVNDTVDVMNAIKVNKRETRPIGSVMQGLDDVNVNGMPPYRIC